MRVSTIEICVKSWFTFIFFLFFLVWFTWENKVFLNHAYSIVIRGVDKVNAGATGACVHEQTAPAAEHHCWDKKDILLHSAELTSLHSGKKGR